MQRAVRNNKKNIRRNNSKWPLVFAITSLVIIYFIFFHGDDGLIQYWRLTNEKNQLKNKIAELRLEQEKLKKEIEMLQNDYQYIEKVARERYKMGREGEKIYVIKK